MSKDGSSLLRILKEGSANSSNVAKVSRRWHWFVLSKLANPTQATQVDISSLENKISDLAFAERLSIAHNIVESALALQGTPWLSSLNISSLKRFKSLKFREQEPRYTAEIIGASTTLQTQLDHLALEGYKIHSYFFAVGVLLVELALQLIVQDIRIRDGQFHLLTKSPDGSAWSSTRRIVTLVDAEVGSDFSRAVKFCLQDPDMASNRLWKDAVLYDDTFDHDEISTQLSDLFYESVMVKCDYPKELVEKNLLITSAGLHLCIRQRADLIGV